MVPRTTHYSKKARTSYYEQRATGKSATQKKDRKKKPQRRLPVALQKGSIEGLFFDVAPTFLLTNNDATSATSMQLLNTIPRDGSASGRTGRKGRASSILIRAKASPSANGIAQRLRIMLVHWRQPNEPATLPTWTEVLATQDALAMSNMNHAHKYQVLRSWICDVEGSTIFSSGKNLFFIDESVPLRDLLMEWTFADTTGVITNFEKGALLLMVVSDTALASGKTPIFQFSSRLYYHE